MCQIGTVRCTKFSTEVHHTEGRGEEYLEEGTWLATCRTCHKWVHGHPKDARELGFLK